MTKLNKQALFVTVLALFNITSCLGKNKIITIQKPKDH